MKSLIRAAILVLLVTLPSVHSFAQDSDGLVTRMRQYESSILLMYLEYQKLYYEDKSRVHELQAFEQLLSVYIDQITEIYETLNLAQRKNQVPRDIAARTLVFKALMFLEKAPLNPHYFERACYEYYAALDIYESTNDPPAIYKDLPQPIQAGTKTYYRMKDILDDKGSGLHEFGKVQISFENFMVTADFDPGNLELIRLQDDAPEHKNLTFKLAEERIKAAFSQIFRKAREVNTYVALPAGTYVLRLHGGSKSDFTALTRFYVAANQQQYYVMEPLADWIVLYEEPKGKRPDFYRYRRNKTTLASDGLSANFSFQTEGDGVGKSETNGHAFGNYQDLTAEIVRDLLPGFEIKMMFDFNDPEIKDNAIEIISKSVVDHVTHPGYYRSWSNWTSSWEIAENVREVISPGSLVPSELVSLIYQVLGEL